MGVGVGVECGVCLWCVCWIEGRGEWLMVVSMSRKRRNGKNNGWE